LVPIANPATAGTLLRLAGVLARQQEGEVLALQVVAVPLGIIMDGIVRDTATRRSIQAVLEEQSLAQERVVVEFEYQIERDEVAVIATMRSVQPIDQTVVDAIAASLREHLDRPVTLEVIALPVTRSGGQ
jgi:hypothetical protein